jgi:hypothetical protein
MSDALDWNAQTIAEFRAPSTHARLLESAPFLCSNLRLLS